MTRGVPCRPSWRRSLPRSSATWLLPLVCVAVAGCQPEAPAFEPPRQVVYLDQGEHWGDRERALFYYTPQGTMLHGLRYKWFQHLEVAEGQRLADPDYLVRFGFLYSPEQFGENYDGGPVNPGNLPVGFSAHYDAELHETMLDISCATCHTGQLEYRGVSLRVDGGQPMHAIVWGQQGQFVPDLVKSMATTYTNPFKFDRFAKAVLGLRYPDDKPKLRAQLEEVLAGFVREGVTTIGLYAEDGYGRLDALSRIADVVFGDDIDLANKQAANAPVSYPHLWDIWKFDWVQWNGSIAQPMGRNVGEAIGVKARIDLLDEHGNPVPPEEMFDSAVLVRELHCIETTLWQLGPPRWPEDILPPIDRARADRGHALYQQHCQKCHGPHVYPDRPEGKGRVPERYECGARPNDEKPTPDKPVEWKMCVVPTWEIGTDPEVVNNFLDRRYDASALDPSNPGLVGITAAEGLHLMMDKVTDRRYEALGISGRERWEMDGWGRENAIRDMRGYKARPLHGVWATPPFLHNGSVRTLYQLLSPQAERETRFLVGSREFDPEHVGYENREVAAAYELDTRHTGNHNTGHQFTDAGGPGVIGPELSHDERLDLIEHIKTLGHPDRDPDYAKYAAPRAGDIACGRNVQGPAVDPELTWPP